MSRSLGKWEKSSVSLCPVPFSPRKRLSGQNQAGFLPCLAVNFRTGNISELLIFTVSCFRLKLRQMTTCSFWVHFCLGLRNFIMLPSLLKWLLFSLPWCTLFTLCGSIRGWSNLISLMTVLYDYDICSYWPTCRVRSRWKNNYWLSPFPCEHSNDKLCGPTQGWGVHLNNVNNHSNISPSHLEGTPWSARLFHDFFTTKKFHFKWLMCACGPFEKKIWTALATNPIACSSAF